MNARKGGRRGDALCMRAGAVIAGEIDFVDRRGAPAGFRGSTGAGTPLAAECAFGYRSCRGWAGSGGLGVVDRWPFVEDLFQAVQLLFTARFRGKARKKQEDRKREQERERRESNTKQVNN